MPKPAATLFGLALVAASIGFNIWRYPIVWRMTDPLGSPVTKAAPPAAPRPAPASVEPSSSPAAATAVRPIKLPPAKTEPASPPLMLAGADPPTPASAAANITALAPIAAAKQSPSAGENLERPLVPVPSIAAAALPPNVMEGANGVRRLPPVDPNMPTLVGSCPSSPPGAVPIYPSTGIH